MVLIWSGSINTINFRCVPLKIELKACVDSPNIALMMRVRLLYISIRLTSAQIF